MTSLIQDHFVLSNAEHHIRCFGHVLNLACGDVLNEIFDKIENIRTIAKRIKYSALYLDKLKQDCNQEDPKVEFRKVILDVKVRWNSTLALLAWFVDLKKPLTRLISEMHDEQAGIDDRIKLVEANEWVHYKWLYDLLQPLDEATTICSGQDYPTFSSVLPIYNSIMDHFEKSKRYYEEAKKFISLDNPDAIDIKKLSDFYPHNWASVVPSDSHIPTAGMLKDMIHGCEAALGKLDKYYNVQSDFSIVAVVLDPRLGLEFYRDPNKTEYQNEIDMTNAKNEVVHYFEPYLAGGTTTINLTSSTTTESKHSTLKQIYKKRKVQDSSGCQVTRYIELDKDDVDENTNVLEWWKFNEHRFPQLAAMARDIFSAVATSTPSERAFSAGKETITDRRNRIGHDVVEALQISKSALKEKRKLIA